MAEDRTVKGGLPEAPEEIGVYFGKPKFDWKRLFFLLVGLGLFFLFYFLPPLEDAADPGGKLFTLTREGKAAIGLFLMAGTWWVFEVIPIGVTSIAIGVVQAMFQLRKNPADAFRDFMDPSVMFIFGSIVVGLAFTKTGLTRRIAFLMLRIVGERTSMILLGSLVLTALLAHFMAHTAAAATVFPILLAVYSLYGEGDKQTNFGKALFIGMAYAAGAGSIITFLGSARGPAAAGMFKEFTGLDVGFFELTKFMFPVGWGMVFLIWGLLMLFLRPEKRVIPGLREEVKELSASLGKITKHEIIVIAFVLGVVLFMTLQSFVPALKGINRAAIILVSTLLFFILRC